VVRHALLGSPIGKTGNEKVLGVFPYSAATALEMEGTESAQKSRSLGLQVEKPEVLGSWRGEEDIPSAA
jgi:hypothetical protein